MSPAVKSSTLNRCLTTDRSHALRGNASTEALRSAFDLGRGASRAAFPRGAWERSACGLVRNFSSNKEFHPQPLPHH
ncbi:hypothetical protein CES87_25975 [Pseudomonas sp. ERMR1:02]|nr:hypothetical protein CES87_25975 [Pseudomonas sp. ERMR1:02]